jgi:hypothetical protein
MSYATMDHAGWVQENNAAANEVYRPRRTLERRRRPLARWSHGDL